MSPGVRQPPRGSRCVEGDGACGRPAAEGTGSGAAGACGTSAGATSSARVADSAAAGVCCFGLLTAAAVPCAALGAFATDGAFGLGAGLSVSSAADTTLSRRAEPPVSCTSPPPAFARSCLRSSLSAGVDEREHAPARASTITENRMAFVMDYSLPPDTVERSKIPRGELNSHILGRPSSIVNRPQVALPDGRRADHCHGGQSPLPVRARQPLPHQPRLGGIEAPGNEI